MPLPDSCFVPVADESQTFDPQSTGKAQKPPSGHGVRLSSRGAWRSLVSALVWGTRGPRFKSGRPD